MAHATGRETLRGLLGLVIGSEPAARILSTLELPDNAEGGGAAVGRATVAMALNAMLFADLLKRVPMASAYVDEVVSGGGKVTFDHGALRTVDGSTGALPRGVAAFTRILEPLGYEVGGLYPLPRLNMTGRAFVHRDRPFDVPQFFVSELHVDRLPPEAQAAAEAIFARSNDPLGDAENALLAALARDGECSVALARNGLPGLARAFAAHHPVPSLEAYQTLLLSSAEAAWLATEGNAFNHATDRVADVASLAQRLKREGWPLKDSLETSASGRVIQTAFLADKVRRRFALADGGTVEREVPGSFYEFITRHVDPATGLMDLSFDSANATGIFAVTRATA